MQKIDENFKNDIDSTWTRKLIGEFYFINNTIKAAIDKRLNDPNFAFTYENWGKWDPLTYTITISYNLLRNFEWDAVVHTLKHEVAHMIVTEIWSDIGDNGQAHGELFSKACNVLDIDDSATHSSIDKALFHLPEKEKVLSRIYKLFCLGESNYKDEAEAAVMKAHELMIKYNISIKELPSERRSFVSRPVGYIFAKVPEYIKNLASLIGEYYFVKHIYIPVFNKGWGRKHPHYIEFYGEPHNVDIAEYIFHFLIHEGERQWKEFQKTALYKERFNEGITGYTYDVEAKDYKQYRKGRYSKVSFICGVYYGFASTLQKRDEDVMKEVNPDNTLPIGAKDPLLEEKYKGNYHPRSWGNWGGSNKDGHSEGAKVGKKIVICQGVSKGDGCTGLLN